MKKFILFDFDGVIANSFNLAFEVYKTISPQTTESQFKQAFEGNINAWIKERRENDENYNKNIDFSDEYVPRIKNEVNIFPGVAEVIKNLSKKYPLILVSSTISSPIQEFIESHNLADSFMEIFGNELHHSKIEKIKMVFDKYAIGPDDCLFVTDTLGDMIEAEKTGVGAMGVSWGFHTHETLGRGNPFKIVDLPSELEPAIAEYFSLK